MASLKINRIYPAWFWTTLLGVAAFLRWWHLGSRSIWLDEAYSLKLAAHGFGEIIHGAAMDIHPPLFHLLLAVWIRVFGTSEWALRSLSASLGLLLIPVAYGLVKTMANKGTARLAVILVACSPYFLELSRLGRMPAMLALLQALALLFFWRFLAEGKLKDMLLFYVSMLAALYTHYFAFLLLGAFFVYIFMGIGKLNLSREIRKKWFLLQFALAAGYAPWLVTLWKHVLKGGPAWRGVGASWWAPFKVIYNLVLSTSCYTPWQKGLAIGLVLIGVVAMFWMLRHRLPALYRQLPPRLWGLLATVVLFTLGVVWLYSRYKLNVWDHRYLSSVALVLVITLSIALNLLDRAGTKMVLFLVLAGFAVPGYNLLFNNIYYDDWRSLARIISQERTAQTTVVLYPPWNETPLNYYLKNQVPLLPLPGRYNAITGVTSPYFAMTAETLPQVSARLQGRKQVLLLVVNEDAPQRLLLYWFEQRYHINWRKNLGSLHLVSGTLQQEVQ